MIDNTTKINDNGNINSNNNSVKKEEEKIKKDSKVKPEIIKKYKEIISEDIIKVELNDETKNIFDKL